MLSIENPPPPDPCEIEIEQLKSSSDEIDSTHSHLDLLLSGPKFSIRDYVSSTRSKDIKTNWPFSRENLQLCLQHGVKDLLPPFQTLDGVRNPSAKRCVVASVLVDKENAYELKEESVRQTNHLVSVTSSDAKPVSDSVSINVIGCAEDREIPSTASSETNSLPSKKTSCLELEADTLRKPEKKVEHIVKPPIKKCRLILKLSSTTDQSSKEDNKSNNFQVLETMASKVCPVCKTFTSSSNTTLNAHIDQCLSGESTIKWTANPQVIKHKIKPRRMKSMVDIYATAVHYTLEDLDKRNGTSWAAGSSLPAQEIEVGAAERKQKSPVRVEESENEEAVYVDANGTKLRILSKFNDLSSPAKVGEHFGLRKFTKGDNGSKLVFNKKKKHGHKHQKLQKFDPHSKKLRSPKHHKNYEINAGQEQNVDAEEDFEKEEAFRQHEKPRDKVKFNGSETMGGWVSSKRTGPVKKMNDKDGQHSTYTKKKESGGEDRELPLRNKYAKSGTGSPNSSKSTSLPPKTTNSSSEPLDEYEKELYVRKRARVSSMESEANLKQLGDRGSSADGGNMDHPHNKANLGSSLSIPRVKIKGTSATNGDSCTVNLKSHHPFSSKTKKFSLRKNQVSVTKTAVLESKSSLKRKLLALKKPKPRVRCASESEKEVLVWQTGVNEQNESVEDLSKVEARNEKEKTRDKVSVDRTRVIKVIKKLRRKSTILRKEEDRILKGSKSALEDHEHDDDDRFDSSVRTILTSAINGNESAVKEINLCGKDIFVEPASGKPVEEACGGISKSSDVRCASREFVKIHDDPFLRTEDSGGPIEPILSSQQDYFFTDGGDENINDPDVHMRTELDSNNGLGNYYIEVDPIPIPGPPGSFLPSPGRMTSEEFQGNSSLTSSQIQSSEDHHEFAYRDSSDSPSATSTISNSDVPKFDSRYLEKLHLFVPQRVHNEIRSSVSGASVDAVVDNLTPDPRAAYTGGERLNPSDPMANTLYPETAPFRFKNDHPCCCSRKEGTILADTGLNNLEPPLSRHPAISLDQQPSTDKQINGGDASRKLNNYNFMSEVLSSGPLVQIPSKASANSEVNFLSNNELASPSLQNTTRYPLGQIPIKASSISEGKFVSNSDEPASPSVSNPVLRLMGKDLMVVNKNEIISPQFRPSQSPTKTSNGNPQSYSASGVYSYDIPKEEGITSHHLASQGPIFSQTQGNSTVTAQHFDVMSSIGYNNGNFGSQRSPHVSPLVLSGRSIAPSCSGSLGSLEYMRGCYFPPEQQRATNRFGKPLACDIEKSIKEIIIIDDAPQNAADFATNAILGVGMGVIRGSESVTVTSGFDPRVADPFYGYQPHISSPCGGSPLAQTATFHQVPPPLGVSSSPSKWNCVPKGSNLLPKSAFPNSSSPANHMRSTLYHSHGFS